MRLARGAADAGDAFHLPALATRDGESVAVRTVVLRRVDRDLRRLCCHTDARSPKAAQLTACPRVAWLFYDPGERVQLRVAGQVHLHGEDELAAMQWAGSGASARDNYRSAGGPGAVLPEPGPGIDPRADDDVARRHFRVVACRADTLDWLLLDAAGHRRARFDFTDRGWRHRWITP